MHASYHLFDIDVDVVQNHMDIHVEIELIIDVIVFAIISILGIFLNCPGFLNKLSIVNNGLDAY